MNVAVRVVVAGALLALAYLYWLWPGDLIPDGRPFGRADDLVVALVNMFAAARIFSPRQHPSEIGRLAAWPPGEVTSAGPAPISARMPDTGRRARPPGSHEQARLGAGGPRGLRELDAVAEALAVHGPPVVVYNASHSGSRLLTRILSGMGVFMGGRLNASEDSIEIAELVEHVILEHAPDFSTLFAEGDPALAELAISRVRAHMAGRPEGARWGWKLCETGHAMPVISRLFPGATFIHLIRDGRDVAFSPFVAPKHPYWRKIHFNTAEITTWRGLGLSQRAYREHGPLFNAIRWANSVTLGRAHGAMLGERYHEVRYERLVTEPAQVARELAAALDLPLPDTLIEALDVDVSRVGKWRSLPRGELSEVCDLIGPTLWAFGYPPEM